MSARDMGVRSEAAMTTAAQRMLFGDAPHSRKIAEVASCGLARALALPIVLFRKFTRFEGWLNFGVTPKAAR
jgi:hypothetical protein